VHSAKFRIAERPESQERVSRIARELLVRSDTLGVLPTPIHVLRAFERIDQIDGLPTRGFFKQFGAAAVRTLLQAMQKVRGVADLRTRANYVPRTGNLPRDRFVDGHELAHQVLPWHRIDPAYMDDDETLRPDIRQVLESEANFFSAEILYQGADFTYRARDFRPDFDAVFSLADDHQTSRQSTAWRFVEVHDEPLGLLQFYPRGLADETGFQTLTLWNNIITSNSFRERFRGLQVPHSLDRFHPWVGAVRSESVQSDVVQLVANGQPLGFEWHSWWNGRCLLVLLRRRPKLGFIGRLVAR
jgi:hypothetical protein